MKAIIAFLSILTIFSCNRTPNRVDIVLNHAGNNRIELEKVISHYENSGDTLKLKASLFLIGNLENKFYYDSPTLRGFDEIFHFLDSLKRNKKYVGVISPIMNRKWDSLVSKYGAPKISPNMAKWDYRTLTADEIIAHIDQAFITRETRWAKGLTFAEFCELILPHRIGTERPEAWNKNVFQEYQMFRDTTTAKTRVEFASRIDNHLRRARAYYTTHVFLKYPYDIPYSKMDLGRRGVCRHLVYNTALIMRANGLPVAVDFISLYANRDKGHHWNVVIKEDGSHFAFDAPGGLPFGTPAQPYYKFAKIYRQTFRTQPLGLSKQALTDIPRRLLRVDRIDVTDRYTKTYDIDIPLTYSSEYDKQYAVICTFDNFGWQAQTWGEIRKDEVRFEKMATNVAYIAMYYHKGQYYAASDPFILQEHGRISYIKAAAKMIDMTLTRKYPLFPHVEAYHKSLIGGRIQAANYPDFRDSVNLALIEDTPEGVETIPINATSKFKYIRYLSPNEGRTDLAEMTIYGSTNRSEEPSKLSGRIIGYPEISSDLGQPYQNVFDDNLNTYFTARNEIEPSWTGLSLDDESYINRVELAPRSDTNFIVRGETYELRYWNGTGWTSMGKQIANKVRLDYQKVPANGLYVLRNLSGGKEERIFTYENGKQIWW